MEATLRALKDEQSRLAAWKHELEGEEEKVKSEVEAMDRQRRQLNNDRQKLEQLAQQVHSKSAEINDLVTVRHLPVKTKSSLTRPSTSVTKYLSTKVHT